MYTVKVLLDTRVPSEEVHQVKDVVYLPAENPAYLALYPRGRDGKVYIHYPLKSLLRVDIENTFDEELGKRK